MFAYWETAQTVLSAWRAPDVTYQHGFAVLLLGAFIAWREWRNRAHALPIRPSVLGLALLAGSSIFWGFATLASAETAQLFALLLVLAILPAALLGTAVARLLFFPFALIVTAWPVWEFLQPPLQGFAARSVEIVLGGAGVPLHRNGTDIHLASGTFLIERACSGLVFTLSGVLAGLLFAYVARMGPLAAVTVAAGAGLVASLGNVIRIASVIYLGELTRMQHVFVTDDHSLFGWAVYAACMLAFLTLVRAFVPAREAAPSAAPVANGEPTARDRFWVPAALALAAVSVGPALVHAYRPATAVLAPVAIELPGTLREWRAESGFDVAETPVRLPADAEVSTHYVSPDGIRVTVHMARYSQQRPGSEAVSRANTIYDERYWKPVATRGRRIDDGMSVRETRLRAGDGSERVLWVWYRVGGHSTGHELEASLRVLWNTLRGDTGVELVGVLAEEGPGTGHQAEIQLAKFVADFRSAIDNPPRRPGGAGVAAKP